MDYTNAVYAVSAGVTSVVPTNQRVSVNLMNVLSADAEALGQPLSYRVLLGDTTQAENLMIETVVDGELIEVPFDGGFAQLDNVLANTTQPTFITFKADDTYIFTIELIDTSTDNLLAVDVEIAMAVEFA